MPDHDTPIPCGSTAPIGNHTCVLQQGHTGLHSDKTLAAITPNGERIVWQLPEDVGDRICGDEYDGEECELEPGHAGGHIAGNLAWSYGRASTADLVLASHDLETDLLGGCGICDTEHWEMCAACQKCRCHRHDECQRPA
ncbi:rhodanese-like domain-containing protein [Streptomyces gardneri]|uniref:hypothetical protein n=1 Tax=Streptomyces gardneri TaxID=66892 RepID=UPI0036A94755